LFATSGGVVVVLYIGALRLCYALFDPASLGSHFRPCIFGVVVVLYIGALRLCYILFDPASLGSHVRIDRGFFVL